MESGTVKPNLQALLVADHVYEDKATGKKVVAGIFHRIVFTPGGAIPKQIEKDGIKKQIIPGGLHAGSPYAYISLTNVRGMKPFVLRYVDLGSDQPLFQTEFQVTCNNPLETVEIVLGLPPLPAGKAGVFTLELLCNDEPIGSFRVQVIAMEGPPDGDS